MEVEVSILLTRKLHWSWSEVSTGDVWQSRWSRDMDPELENWLKANGASTKQHVVEIKYGRMQKARKDSYLRFTNRKLARNFILAWDIPEKNIFYGHFDKRVANARLDPKYSNPRIDERNTLAKWLGW